MPVEVIVVFDFVISILPFLYNLNSFTVVEVIVIAIEILYQTPVERVLPVVAPGFTVKTPPELTLTENDAPPADEPTKKRVAVELGNAFK